jgi:DNA polymerase-1
VKITLAIDATNRVHRLWHVMHNADQVARQFVRDVGTLVDAINPQAVVCAFDSATCFRRAIFSEYKLGRAAKEQGLRDALELSQAESARDYPIACVESFEADDVLATVAAECCATSQRCVIASPDKDLRQCLVDGRVSILKTWKGSGPRWAPEWITALSLESQLGIGPDQWIDFQCLVGDSGDNITGAKGVGDKTARKLLFEAQSLDKLLENRWLSAELSKSEKLWQSLLELKTRLPIVRQLVTLRTDVPGVAELLREGAIA